MHKLSSEKKNTKNKLAYFIPTKTKAQVYSKDQKFMNKTSSIIKCFFSFYTNFKFSRDEITCFYEIKNLFSNPNFISSFKNQINELDCSFLDIIEKEKVFYLKENIDDLDVDDELKDLMANHKIVIKLPTEFSNYLSSISKNIISPKIDLDLYFEHCKKKFMTDNT